MTWEELLSRIRQRYDGLVEIDEEGENPVLVVAGARRYIPIPDPLYALPMDEVPAGFRRYLCQQLPQLHPTDVGLDWPKPDA